MDTLIIDSLNYYDKQESKFSDFKTKYKYVSFVPSNNDIEKDYVYFFDEEKELKIKYQYEYLGMLHIPTSLWVWGWSNPTAGIIRNYNLLKYGFDIIIDKNDLNKDVLDLKSQLITSRYLLTNKLQIEIHKAIMTYILKSKYIFIYKHNPMQKEITKMNNGAMANPTEIKNHLEEYYFNLLEV